MWVLGEDLETGSLYRLLQARGLHLQVADERLEATSVAPEQASCSASGPARRCSRSRVSPTPTGRSRSSTCAPSIAATATSSAPGSRDERVRLSRARRRHAGAAAPRQLGRIEEAAGLVADALRRDAIVHIFGTGHSHLLAEEALYRAGGLAPVNAILDPGLMLREGAPASTRLERIPATPRSSPASTAVAGRRADRRLELRGQRRARGDGHAGQGGRAQRDRHLLPELLAAAEPEAEVAARLLEVADLTLDNLGEPGRGVVDGAACGGAYLDRPGAAVLERRLRRGGRALAAEGVSRRSTGAATCPGPRNTTGAHRAFWGENPTPVSGDEAAPDACRRRRPRRAPNIRAASSTTGCRSWADPRASRHRGRGGRRAVCRPRGRVRWRASSPAARSARRRRRGRGAHRLEDRDGPLGLEPGMEGRHVASACRGARRRSRRGR